jgi:hypothetical protein
MLLHELTLSEATPLSYFVVIFCRLSESPKAYRGHQHPTTWSSVLISSDLVRFFSMVMSGNEAMETSEKMKCLAYSIGQDICRAVSEGKWKLPKHMLLCVTVRYLFRIKQLTKILHRLGHSETYDFGLEMETALANALDEVSTYLTPQRGISL